MTAFDTAWDLVKAELPDLDLGGEYQIHSSPRFGMHSEPGDMEYSLYTMPGTAMDILDDFYSDEDWKTAAPYDVMGIKDRIREFRNSPEIFNNPLNVAQRQNARYQGSAHPYSVFSSAMTDEDNNLVQRWLEGLEDEGAPANLAQAHVSPSGEMKRAQSHRRHILTKKSTKRKRHLRDDLLISKADKAVVKKMLPY